MFAAHDQVGDAADDGLEEEEQSPPPAVAAVPVGVSSDEEGEGPAHDQHRQPNNEIGACDTEIYGGHGAVVALDQADVMGAEDISALLRQFPDVERFTTRMTR